ncbi:MAG: T9SS type A sorting domain-containing protein [Bacteroidales bacterium]|nr:T9SS type A sorting domain-containing protein [Bacteroidales bacterium]
MINQKLLSIILGIILFSFAANAQKTDIVTTRKTDNAVNVTDKNPSQSFCRPGAKNEITIGTGTESEEYPIYAFYNYSYTQSIYLQSEIGAADDITKIWYYFNGSTLSNSNNWTIYIGHTTKTQFDNNDDWIDITSLTEVYSGTFTDPGGAGWIEFDITDFAYNGTDNLIIAVDENAFEHNAFDDLFYNSIVTNNRSMVCFSDYNNPDPASPQSAQYNKAFIPNIRILLGESPVDDLGVIAVTPSGGILSGSTFTPTVTVRNYGTDDQAAWEITLISAPAAYSELITNPGNITAGSDLIIDFPEWTPAVGTYTLTATVILVDDSNPDNDELSDSILVIELSNPIYKQHQIINEQGTHTTGDDVSMLEATQNTGGYGFQYDYDNWVADDFTVPAGETWNITGFNFFGYQTGTPADTSTFTGAYAKIYDGNPSAGGTLIHDFSSANLQVITFFINAYRIAYGAYTNSDRPINQIVCFCPEVSLTEGTYWISWAAQGSAASGPWTPHLQLTNGNTTTGNAIQWEDGSWEAITDVGNQGMPFDLLGSVDGLNNINLLKTDAVKIYPNPSNGVFTICVDNNYKLEVINITGKIVYTQELIQAQTDINLPEQAGVYLIRLTNNERTIRHKIIVK